MQTKHILFKHIDLKIWEVLLDYFAKSFGENMHMPSVKVRE